MSSPRNTGWAGFFTTVAAISEESDARRYHRMGDHDRESAAYTRAASMHHSAGNRANERMDRENATDAAYEEKQAVCCCVIL